MGGSLRSNLTLGRPSKKIFTLAVGENATCGAPGVGTRTVGATGVGTRIGTFGRWNCGSSFGTSFGTCFGTAFGIACGTCFGTAAGLPIPLPKVPPELSEEPLSLSPVAKVQEPLEPLPSPLTQPLDRLSLKPHSIDLFKRSEHKSFLYLSRFWSSSSVSAAFLSNTKLS